MAQNYQNKNFSSSIACFALTSALGSLSHSTERHERTPVNSQLSAPASLPSLCWPAWPALDSAGSSSALQPIDSSTAQPPGTAWIIIKLSVP